MKSVIHAFTTLVTLYSNTFPNSKVHGANMGPTWGRQDPGGPHAGPMKLAIWVSTEQTTFFGKRIHETCYLTNFLLDIESKDTMHHIYNFQWFQESSGHLGILVILSP